MTQLFPPSPLAAAQAFLLSLPGSSLRGSGRHSPGT